MGHAEYFDEGAMFSRHVCSSEREAKRFGKQIGAPMIRFIGSRRGQGTRFFIVGGAHGRYYRYPRHVFERELRKR